MDVDRLSNSTLFLSVSIAINHREGVLFFFCAVKFRSLLIPLLTVGDCFVFIISFCIDLFYHYQLSCSNTALSHRHHALNMKAF